MGMDMGMDMGIDMDMDMELTIHQMYTTTIQIQRSLANVLRKRALLTLQS